MEGGGGSGGGGGGDLGHLGGGGDDDGSVGTSPFATQYGYLQRPSGDVSERINSSRCVPLRAVCGLHGWASVGIRCKGL